MGAYVTNKNKYGKTGVSAAAMLSLATISASQISFITIDSKNTTVKIYGNLIKIILSIKVDAGKDIIEKCAQVKEEVTSAFLDQLEIRSIDVRVVAVVESAK